jgi:hypothetical protein
MTVFDLVMWILAGVCFGLAAFGWPRGNPSNVHLGWFGALLIAVAVLTPF